MTTLPPEQLQTEAAKLGISEAMAYHVVMTNARQGRVITMSAAEQPRDDLGRWTADGGGGGAATDYDEKSRRNVAIMEWSNQHGETGSKILANIERLVHQKGLSISEAAKKAYAKRAKHTRYALGDELYEQMLAEGKIREGPPLKP